ncbi:TonB-dependent receptor [Chitinophaga sancti]|uniref:Iron complex outermembrane recepter protein n=1 Tax=Chitinophaga sancti TaxID=1004 RepID=A0A1K1RAM9_9BACT|nr:TonB-dependent receptor [Chitinophaga sancti]WQD65548.1 TonB-dependent receptor [Chitinophaga sancti]WQG88829.1 TonB-dependent receptor [Chitinophaga sancti]SFW69128.1 iron complex outermembrane recepter protein [Chitinophaga sancti]
MFRITTILASALLLSTLCAFAQHNISGTVKDINNQPLQKVSISLKGHKHTTFSDGNGSFHMEDLPTGIYTIHFSHTGFQGQDIAFNTDSTRPVDIVLLPSLEQLQTVEITGRKEIGYKNTNTFIGTKTATPLREVPASIAYVTKELIQDQAAVRIGDVVKNMSGVNQFTFYDDLTIRGFRINGGSTTQLMNGMRTFTGFWKQPMVNYLERVEVIKGPASALFGNASPGGVINRVTKKPLDEDRKSLSFTMGSFNSTRALLDFTGPLNEDKTILYRLNLGYENAESFRVLQFDKNLVIAPSVSFLPNKKTRINFDAVYNKSNSRLDRGQSVFMGQGLYSTPISQALNATNDYLNEETYTVMASLNHQFSSRLAFNLAYLRTGYTEDLLEHRSANENARDAKGIEIPSLIARQVFVRKKNPASANASMYLTYDANTGKIEHKLLAGYDYSQATLSPGASQMTATNYQLKSGGVAPYYPADSLKYVTYEYKTASGEKIVIPKPNVPSFDLLNPNNVLEDMNRYVYTAQNSAVQPTFNSLGGMYLQDQIKLGALQLLLGVRYETYTDRRNYKKANQKKVNQHAFLPRIGLVYTATKNINVYGVYTRGYNPQDAAIQSNPASGGPFNPIESELIEGGLKTEWLEGKLTGNLSIYHIIQKGTLYLAGVRDQPELYLQIGKERAQGVELDITGQITKDWNIIANYSYNDAVITEAKGDDSLKIGDQKPNAPKHQGNLWTKYTIPAGKVKGLGIGVGANFVTTRNVSLNATQTLPGYALLNAALYYKVNKVQLQVNFNNLTDKTYWVGGYDYLRLFPGAPRNWQATISYTF